MPINQDYLQDASGFVGHAERLFTPENENEVSEILRNATRERIGVTISGAGTGVVGGRVPQGGWILSVSKFRQLEIEPGRAIVGAGITLKELHDAAART